MKNLHITNERFKRLNAAWQNKPSLVSLLGVIGTGAVDQRLKLPGELTMIIEGKVGNKNCKPAELVVVAPGIILFLPRDWEITISNPLNYAGLFHWTMTNGCGLWVTTSFGSNPYNCMVGIERQCPQNSNRPALVFKGKGNTVYEITPEHYDEIHNFLTHWIDYNVGKETRDHRNAIIDSDDEK